MRSWLVVLCLAGCLQADLTPCGDLLCPSDSVCTRGGCASLDQVKSCEGLGDRDACVIAGKAGTCEGDACVPQVCGDGRTTGSELCDDGNQFAGDGCSPDCLSKELCGNGIVDRALGEQCDDGNTDEADTCRTNCIVPRCGDGIVDLQNGEACDAAAANSNAADAACRLNCQPARCGDGIHDSNEACDDGNLVSGDACSGDCRSLEVCGNGIVDGIMGEQCDVGRAGLSDDGCSSTCRAELATWEKILPTPLAGRIATMVAWDSTRQRLVMFGGFNDLTLETFGDTWEWDGTQWERRLSRHSPSPRLGGAMAYDSVRRRVVLFGGQTEGSNLPLDDTWEWDGIDWTARMPTTRPALRYFHAMAYDVARARTVLYGGAGTSTYADTWEWDGTTWTLRTPTISPGPRYAHAMTYDSGRGQVVLFSGSSSSAPVDDLWAWNGTDWLLVSSGGAGARQFPGLAYDESRGRLVVFGGSIMGGPTNDSWEWTGTTWLQTNPTSPPSSRQFPTLTSTFYGMILFAGGSTSETWSYTPTAWSQLPDTVTTPPWRYNAVSAWDPLRGEAILFGGAGMSLRDTWRWRGTWLDAKVMGPSGRDGAAMAFDGTGLVMFGGFVAGGVPTNEVWRWDGAAWAELHPAVRPPAMSGAAMAYDAANGQVVLFGGEAAGSNLSNATWLWNGTTWQQASVTGPSKRRDAGMTYDSARGRIVMFGGVGPLDVAMSDLWEWTGTAWVSANPSVHPAERSQMSLAYDPQRGRVLMYGGAYLSTNVVYDDLWEWDGTTWRSLSQLGIAPGFVYAATAFYDPVGRRFIVHDGLGRNTTEAAGTFEYAYRGPAAHEACQLAGDDVDGDGFTTCADPDCWARCAPLCPPLASCAPTAPHCGDGVCGPVEDWRLCPADCAAP